MIQIKKTILTLVALLAVTTGAWAQTPELLVTIESKGNGTTSGQTFDGKAILTFGGGQVMNDNDNWGWYNFLAGEEISLTVTGADGYTVTSCTFYTKSSSKTVEGEHPTVYVTGSPSQTYTATGKGGNSLGEFGVTKIEVYGYKSAATGPEVAWNKASKTGTFTMPGGNVTVSVEYYDLATLADNGLTAAVDAAAKTEAPLAVLAENAVTGGTLMYFVIYDENFSQADAIALAEDEWEAAIPTAETIDEAGSYYVWYYIKGDDEHSDTDPQRLAVTVLPEPTYAVTFADGVNPEPPAEPEWTASPATGVKKGETVTVTYTGPRKVMGVKAEKKREAKTLAEATSEDIGKIAGADGNIYDSKDAAEAANTTAVAMIAYVGTASDCAHGLAIALADEGLMNWATAKSTCEAKTPAFTGSTWKLPSQDEWKQMFSANGGNEESYDGLNTAITTAGGTAFQDGTVSYWSSSEYDSDQAHLAQFYYGYPLWFKDWKVNERYVRACLAF